MWIFLPALRQGSCPYVFTSGRKDSEGGWYWAATGQPFSYTDWGPTEPNNTGGNEDVVEFNEPDTDTYRWNDKRSSAAICSLCEIPL